MTENDADGLCQRSSRQESSRRAEKRSPIATAANEVCAGHDVPSGSSSSERAASKPPVSRLRNRGTIHRNGKRLRPAKRAAQARANHKAGAISREQAAVYLGVGYSTLEKLAARGEGPFCFKVGNLVRYPVEELEPWKRANDARQQT
jgi:excisionase family DNA binding protein